VRGDFTSGEMLAAHRPPAMPCRAAGALIFASRPLIIRPAAFAGRHSRGGIRSAA